MMICGTLVLRSQNSGKAKAAVKIVPIREGKERFEFRGEFYNAFNHPNFSQPAAALGTPQFGQIFGTAITMREIQLAAKLYF